MPRFNVLCIGDVHETMMPFDANDIKYFEYFDYTETFRKIYEAHKNDEDFTSRYRERNIVNFAKWWWGEDAVISFRIKKPRGSYVMLTPSGDDIQEIMTGLNPRGIYDHYIKGKELLIMKSGRHVSTALKEEIDFDAMRDEKVVKNRKLYNMVIEACKGPIPEDFKGWPYFVKKMREEWLDEDEAHRQYLSQSTVITYLKTKKHSKVLPSEYELYKFQCTEDEYAASSDKTPCGGIIKDGNYIRVGDRPTPGIIEEIVDPEHWEERFNEIIDSVDDYERLTIIECHM